MRPLARAKERWACRQGGGREKEPRPPQRHLRGTLSNLRCERRGRPEQCQLRGDEMQKNAERACRVAVGKRSHDRPKDICGARSRICGVNGAVASSNASSEATRFDYAYGKYWRRELPGLKPVRQWKIERACAREWRRELPGLEPIRQRKIANRCWPRRRERSATHHSPSPGAALCKQRRAAKQ